ncbi:Scr1 family TA system antitoxin-like transcriptional regulator [Streptacidiphilus sp. P02-A3a]|uniref:Scr1 family TA system antitoxin-like transcriptional regulator n=1 Tax=Streptacidiphilus sp. P02-A3a TaxID=2704468 RepID=UPI0015F93D35|nr:Scr1 family TA system antitoxin-like transcriptional regulator [Streptacidiphilus sp. P02-A3a]QMU70108.1 helix-turn-helix domain-containing protein [Streptacidiphilus sp. P02-A3a]QMU70439.1 helix-turn-helix domain-containing protein [Streptacidiphilus sp. P02-A3a]
MTLDPEQLGQSQADLAEILKELRRRAGLSGARLAERCNMSQPKISKIETGRTVPTLVDVERILRALDAPPSLAAEVSALARIANTEWQDFRSMRRKGLEKKQNELAHLERSSAELRFFLPTMITSLLSTPEYIRATLAGVPGDHAKAIARKLDRQSILYDTSKEFIFLLTEQAVRWPLLPLPAMAMQIDRLVSVSRLPGVRLGVLPLAGHMPLAPVNVFTVYDRRMATVETSTGVMVFKDPRDTESYLDEFSSYERHASWGDDARNHLGLWAQLFR